MLRPEGHIKVDTYGIAQRSCSWMRVQLATSGHMELGPNI